MDTAHCMKDGVVRLVQRRDRYQALCRESGYDTHCLHPAHQGLTVLVATSMHFDLEEQSSSVKGARCSEPLEAGSLN